MKEINMSRTFTRCVGDNSARPSSMLRLRLRGPSGTATGSFDGAASIESFLVAASEQLGCAGAKIDMLVGFPPKQCEVSGAPLSSVVGSGDTVVLNVLAAPAPAPAPAAAPAPGSAGPTPALGGMWACGACTLENEAVASACVACETPRPGGGAGKAQLQKMADDNSCLFHAVAYCLNISSSPAQVGGSGLGVGLRLLALTLDHRLSPDPASPAAQLREQIVRAVRAEPERWNEATLGKPVEAYCAFIADPKRWGGQACHPAPPPPHPRPHPQPPAPCTHILHPHPAPGALHPAPLPPCTPAPCTPAPHAPCPPPGGASYLRRGSPDRDQRDRHTEWPRRRLWPRCHMYTHTYIWPRCYIYIYGHGAGYRSAATCACYMLHANVLHAHAPLLHACGGYTY